MPTKKEMQSQQTKDRLAQVLLCLLETQPLAKISIRSLTDACEIDRQTFYYHFNDIYDLMRYAFEQSILPTLSRAQSGANLRATLTEVMLFVEKNRRALATILASGGRRIIYNVLYQDTHASIAALVVPVLQENGVPLPVAESRADRCKLIIIDGIIDWVEGFSNQTAEVFIDATIDAVEGYLYGTLHRNGVCLLG